MLLITAVTTASATLVNGVSSMLLTSVEPQQMLAYYQCAVRATQDAAGASNARPGGEVPPFVFDCHDPRAGTGWAVTAGATVLLLLVIGCVYACLPAWRSRRRGYRELAGMPELSASLDELTRTAGLHRRVTFLAEPLQPGIDALAFGHVRRRRVVLSGGLLALFARDRDAFRTVVLHELAHIRNRDLDVAFLTLIVWRMNGPLLLASAALAVPGSLFLGPELAASNLTHAVRLGLLAVLAAFLKNSVLRSRELYADARVRSWEGSPDSLLRLFRTYGLPSAPRSGWRSALLRVHPTAALRERALVDERLLGRGGFWDFCAVGATAAFLYDFVALGPIGGGSQAGAGTEALAAGLATALLIGAAGTALWRESARPPEEPAGYGSGRRASASRWGWRGAPAVADGGRQCGDARRQGDHPVRPVRGAGGPVRSGHGRVAGCGGTLVGRCAGPAAAAGGGGGAGGVGRGSGPRVRLPDAVAEPDAVRGVL
ncbi:M48 family metalloprotease, partial [Kitasatospora cheerisanensis]|uniref:M48 family metalloprotease n=1 Tax=Kitasatospora cheerisanensis TaxID=81942 RepID=UPI0012EE6EAB